MRIKLGENEIEQFNQDGFLILESVLNKIEIETACARFEPLFAGEFQTGVQPDEWNWRAGLHSDSITRQICNGWKADRTIASFVLREDVGQACANLANWPGARINQDNVIWKPPAAKALGFHQDDSYQQWIVPAEMMTCWMTLDATRSDQGTIEYVKGSHRWPVSPPIEQFHAPDNPQAEMRAAAHEAGVTNVEPLVTAIEVPAGSVVFHHGRTWHGSGVNSGKNHRRSIISHCCSSKTNFHPTNISPIYSRYRQQGTDEMSESFFPVLWQNDGYRSGWIDSWLNN